MSYISDVEKQAIGLMESERNLWWEMEAYITDKIAFRGRRIIERSRKNYFSIFDNQYDPITNRKKLFIPLTRDMVETTVKNVDIDTSDIGVRAKTPDSYGLATLSRYILTAYLDKLRFGQILNRVVRKQAVEGVAVMKKYACAGKVQIKLLENLNFITDPTADYLSESSGNQEDNWLTLDEISQYQGEWDNLSNLSGTSSIERIPNLPHTTEIPYIGVTERWGLIPKNLLTGNPQHKNIYLEGVIVASGLRGATQPTVHLIAENKTGKRPYEEFRSKKYDGRWLGLGIGEDLADLQSYINEVFNIRLSTNRIKQLGLFQIRKGSGITPQMLNQLHGSGGIQVSRIGTDIAELRTSDMKPSSYKDEDQAYQWAQRMTGAWEIGRGEQLPASMPATTAILQEKGMNSGFSLQQEELGFSISKFIENLLLPAVFETLKDKQIQQIIGDPDELKILQDMTVSSILNDEILKYHKKNGYYPDKSEIEAQRVKAQEKFRKTGKQSWINIKKSLFSSDKISDSVEVFVTDESFNKLVMARELNSLLINYANVPGIKIDSDKIVAEILDLMGLSSQRFMKSPEQLEASMAGMMPPGTMPPGMPQPAAAQAVPPVTAETERVSETVTAELGGRALAPSM